ncbi:hypothetical protein SH449x_005432 [Pirellulaceae bacterium SH449]
MLPIKKSIRLILLGLIALAGLPTPGVSQDDHYEDRFAGQNQFEDEKPNGFSAAIGKIFARKTQTPTNRAESQIPSTSRESNSPDSFGPDSYSPQDSRGRSVTAQTTGGPRGTGGMFVPLRSFTNRVFRGHEEIDYNEMRMQAFPEESILSQQTQLPSATPSLESGGVGRSAGNGNSGGNEIGSALMPQAVESQSSEPFISRDSAASPTNQAKVYSGAGGRSVNATGIAPNPLSQQRQSAPIINNPPNLENKSTSRRTPVGTSGIAESIALPKENKQELSPPTSLVDLSVESQAASSRDKRAQTSNTDRGIETAIEGTPEREQSPEGAGPVVSRNRVPNLSEDRPTNAQSARPQSNTAGSDASSQPRAKLDSGLTQPASASRESLLELNQPGISIQISGPNAMVVGQETIYEVNAGNQGRSDLNGLLVRLSLPDSVAIGNLSATSGDVQPDREDGDNAIIWEVPMIRPGEKQTLALPLRTMSAEHFSMNVEWTALPQTQELKVQVHEPKLDLALEGPAEAEYGVPVKYRLRIKNPGNAVAKMVEIQLAAESFGSNQSVIGDIAPGAERSIDVELLFEQGGVIPLRATASSAVSQIQTQSTIDVRVKQSRLIASWIGPATYFQGNVADYQLTLTNQGDATIELAKCTVMLPKGADPQTLPPGSSRRGNTVQWDVKKLPPNESITMPFGLTFSDMGNTELVFNAEVKNGEPVSASQKIVVDAIEDLKLAVIPPVAPAPVGQAVTYEIEIHNRGMKAAQEVAVIAQFSDGIEPVKVEGHTGQIVPGQVVFQTIPRIGPNERLTLKVFAKASTSGVHRFRAEVKGLNAEVDLVQEGSTRYVASGVPSSTRR